MADTKITGLTANTAPIVTDIMPMVDDPGGSAATQKITIQNLRQVLTPASVCEGRLTLTSATPVTTADVNNATTLYFTPYKGKKIGLYSGSAWNVYDFTELSLNIAAFTASKPYDIFCYDNSGTPTLEGLVWTDATNRATALAFQDGIYVKNGATTRRYLGTIYMEADQKTDDSVTMRNVWNYYNRVLRWMYLYDGTAHNYTTGTYRSWNNSTANRVTFVQGVLEDAFDASIAATMDPSADGVIGYVAIGLDVTNANSLNLPVNWGFNLPYATLFMADARLPAAAGYHFLQAVEYGATTVSFSEFYLRAKVWG